MNILFIVQMDDNNKAGLFLATHNRIKYLKKKTGVRVNIISVKKYDGRLLTLIKKIFKRTVYKKTKASFLFEGITYNNIYIKDTLTKKLLNICGKDLFYYKKVIKSLDIKGIDIISAHWVDLQGSLAFYLKKFRNIPYTLTCHGSDIHTLPYKSKTYKRLVVRNLNNANNVFFVSEYLKEEAKKLGWNESNLSYISYNTIDSKIFFPLSKEEIKKIKKSEKVEEYIVGFVGNLNYIKRANFLVPIFEKIQEKFESNITFYIIGEGPCINLILKQINKSLIDIRFVGEVNQQKLRTYFNIMDCLILPSKSEGLGNVILEAQACGTPVVATNTGGISEAIANKENLVKNNDITIKHEISERVTLILNNRKRIKSNYRTWEDIANDELKIFSEIVSKNTHK
ncbi:glycosyltransferase [Caldifermentibacillus hisashii]|uniref:glycosyltransferase n=1 Tax=Caldifermentibacillus hisashii TaxID=996558 RepID=UPI0034D53365